MRVQSWPWNSGQTLYTCMSTGGIMGVCASSLLWEYVLPILLQLILSLYNQSENFISILGTKSIFSRF